MNETSSTTEQASWATEFSEEIDETADGSFVDHLAVILRDSLLSTSSSAAEIAKCIDAYYTETYLPSSSEFQNSEDKGMTNFISNFYTLICSLAEILPYDSNIQDRLVQVIVELRKLPPKEVKIWNELSYPYVDERVSGVVIEDTWYSSHAMDLTPSSTSASPPPSPTEQTTSCNHWLNFNAFLARCTASGLDVTYKIPIGLAAQSISEGLYPRTKGDNKEYEDCMTMVALQYLYYTGKKKRFWRQSWAEWRVRVEEIAKGADGHGDGEKVREMAGRVGERMRVEDGEVEGESKTDTV